MSECFCPWSTCVVNVSQMKDFSELITVRKNRTVLKEDQEHEALRCKYVHSHQPVSKMTWLQYLGLLLINNSCLITKLTARKLQRSINFLRIGLEEKLNWCLDFSSQDGWVKLWRVCWNEHWEHWNARTNTFSDYLPCPQSQNTYFVFP